VSERIESSDSFGTANSFNAFGTNVLVAFLGSFLKLERNGTEETRSKLETPSFVDDINVFLE
jgi:hypothetical protein